MTKIKFFEQRVNSIKKTIIEQGPTINRLNKLFAEQKKLELAKAKRIN